MKALFSSAILAAVWIFGSGTGIAQTSLGDALEATNLVWTTGGTGAQGWAFIASSGASDTSFDGIDSAESGQTADNGESWLSTTVTGPGTLSFWWNAFCEPGVRYSEELLTGDWMHFLIDDAVVDSVTGVGDEHFSYPSGWIYRSYAIPSGVHTLTWRYVKDFQFTGGTDDAVWLDQVKYVTEELPLSQALNTSEVEWVSGGNTNETYWFAQGLVTKDGTSAAQSGAIYHGQTNWLQATVLGATNLSFWWKVSSEPNNDVLEFLTNGVLAARISGEVDWQSNFFTLRAGQPNTVMWVYRRNQTLTAGSNCGWLDQVTFRGLTPKADSSTTVSASVNPSVFGQSVTFTASVNAIPPGTGTPTGTVTFKDGSTPLGTVSLSAGQAAFATSSLSVGSHSITATYIGDPYFRSSDNNGSPLVQNVNRAGSTVAVASSNNPSVFGQTVSFTATVSAASPGTGTPTGTIQFAVDGSALGSPVSLSGGTATSEGISSLALAGHTVTAVYSGDGNFTGTNNAAAPLTQTVNRANTTTVVSAAANPAVRGQAVSYTATVSAAAPGAGTPGGTVQFAIDGTPFGSPVTLSGGTASSETISSLSVGSHTVTATYSGDTAFNASANTGSPLTQTVNRANTATAVVSSQNPSIYGQSVTFTATVNAVSPGSGTPTGTVTFKDGTNSLATAALSGGQATCLTAALSVTAHAITAVYNGDASFNTSTSTPLTQTVNKGDTTTTVAASVNPSVAGQGVTFTATVAAVSPPTGVPTGTVQFRTNGVNVGSPVTLSSGSATSAIVSALPVGTIAITAVYSGDSNFKASTGTLSGGQSVTQAESSILLASSANPSVVGQFVSFNATVSAVAPGSGTPTGTVQFKTNGVNFGGPVALAGGGAGSLAISVPSVGALAVTAVYSGDSSFKSSNNTGAPLTQTVNKASTTTTVGSQLNPCVLGDPVTFTAAVSALAPGAGTVTGTVQFRVDGADFGAPIALSGGSASSPAISSLSQGNHLITAVYSGDGNFTASTSSTLTQAVNGFQVTAAIGGSAVSADTTAGAYTLLTGPTYTENAGGEAGMGTLILNVPQGFVFDTGGTLPTVRITGSTAKANNINAVANGTSLAMTSVTTTQLVFTITSPSLVPNTLTWQNVRIRPKAGTPLASGNLWMSGTATVVGISPNANCGTLREISGAAAALGIQIAPSAIATAGEVFAQGPVIQVRDQFGNLRDAANGNADNSTVVTATRSQGSGTLQGTTARTSVDGLVSFDDLGHLVATNITISFSSGGLTPVTSGAIVINPAAVSTLVFLVQPANGAAGSILGTQPVVRCRDAFGNDSVVGMPPHLAVTVALTAGTGILQGTTSQDIGTSAGNGTAVFTDLRIDAAGSDKQLTASATGLASALSSVFAVSKAPTTTTVASSANPSVFGQAVTFTAAVSASFGAPTGVVAFKEGTTTLGTGTLSSGQASFTTSAISTGSHANITAVFVGDDNYLTSTSPSITQTVNAGTTATMLTSSDASSTFGQPVVFTAAISPVSPGAGTPTGTVTFKDGATALSTVALSGGEAYYTNSTLTAGAHSITATYNGDSNFNGGTSAALNQTVGAASTALALTASVNPSVFGQSVSFTATVSALPPAVTTPAGTVQFMTNGVNFGAPVTLSGGAAGSPPLPNLSIGTVNVTAVYSGTSEFEGSDNIASPLSQTINKAGATVTITSSESPASVGNPITWTATVSAAAPGAGTPTGTIQFTLDGANIDGVLNLSAGSATSLPIATLAPGSHVITAVYSGDGNFSSSTSAGFSQIVNVGAMVPASGGSAISADTAGGAYTSLAGPVYTEPGLGAVQAGTIILNAPAGFVFDTSGTAPTVRITGNASSGKNINDAVSGTALPMTSVTATQLIFTVTAVSGGGGTPNTLTWQDIRVRPIAGTPLAAGSIIKTGTSVTSGLTNGANAGFLAETAGAASRLALQVPPSNTAVAGLAFVQQPVVQIQDQFGNALTFANRNADNSTFVNAGLDTGSSTLNGVVAVTATNGLAVFKDLSYMKAETITLRFSGGSAAAITSGSVVVGPANADRLVFSSQPGSAIYGSELDPQPVVRSRDAFGNDSTVGLAANLSVTLILSAGTGQLEGTATLDIGTSAGNGTAAFAGLRVNAAGVGKQLTASAAGLESAISSSFVIEPAATPVTIHGLTLQSDGNMEVDASGTPSVTYLMQASTNLTFWEPIGTSTADSEGRIRFLDQNATNYPSRFYRTVLQ